MFNYRLATKLDKEEEAHQLATLLAVIGKRANKLFCTFTWALPDNTKKIAVVLSNFEEHCIPLHWYVNALFSFVPFLLAFRFISFLLFLVRFLVSLVSVSNISFSCLC